MIRTSCELTFYRGFVSLKRNRLDTQGIRSRNQTLGWFAWYDLRVSICRDCMDAGGFNSLDRRQETRDGICKKRRMI